MKKIYVVGLGPGNKLYRTHLADKALEESDVLCGYTVYVNLVKDEFPEKELLATAMRKEVDRCRLAYEEALKGKTVSMLASGDPNVYALASLMFTVREEYEESIPIEIIPGITSALSGAALLGAPLTHDFALISLSDLLTEYTLIEKRLRCAAMGDFCVCLYNPSSKKRHDYLQKACDILLEYKSPETICGIVKNIARENEQKEILTLKELRNKKVDMFTTVFIGNEKTREIKGQMVTPRGYHL